MKEFVIGFHAGHNASACIGRRGELLYAIQEERLTGEKNYWGVPTKAIQACIESQGIRHEHLHSIVHGGVQAHTRYHSREDVLYAYERQKFFSGRIRQRIMVPLVLAFKTDWGQSALRAKLADMRLSDVPFVAYDHHQAHAATAYYGLRTSPTERRLVLTCDGSGDANCATVRIMGPTEDHVLAATHWSNSIGALYAWVTYCMGFVPLEHEYKLMGMAPYASPKYSEELAEMFEQYVGLDSIGLGFRTKTGHSTSALVHRLLRDMTGKRFDSICGGLQLFAERLLCGWTQAAVKASGLRKIFASGGVFMNVKANKRIAELPEVDDFEAFPSCGDETLAMGGFYLEAAKHFGNDSVMPLKHFYLGDTLDDASVAAAIRAAGYHVHKPESIVAEVARLLMAGHPVARAAGRMEFGARALGNRSILADPSNHDVVRVINQMVKKRDFWMPFAPMVRDQDADRYLKNPKKLRSPYMMMTFDTKENFREIIAAVHNADLTCRAQILERDQNPEMYEILNEFHRLTGRGVILNTSFNLHGFPIVRTADEALDVLKQSGLEYLQVGNYLVSKGARSASVESEAGALASGAATHG